MRKKFVAGNWKMNKTVADAKALVADLIPGLAPFAGIELAVCPPFTALAPLNEMLKDTNIGLGAQNIFWETSGAYTAEIAPPMVAELCQYVIIGHSERRQYFGETDETVNRRVKAALEVGLTPIVCIGETLEENQAGLTRDTVSRQVRNGLANLTPEQAQGILTTVWDAGAPISGMIRALHLLEVTPAYARDIFTCEFESQ